MTPHLEIFPTEQRVFWDKFTDNVPKRFVLYGGTAVALRYGHRHSIDFDFFSNGDLDPQELFRLLPIIDKGEVLQQGQNELIARVSIEGRSVALSFFSNLEIGRVGNPDVIPGHAIIASPLDLLATKLKALHDRIEAKDYLDIEVLLRGGITLNEGLSAAMALFGASLNPLDTVKAVAWFKDGDLETTLPQATKEFLEEATEAFDPAIRPALIISKTLAP